MSDYVSTSDMDKLKDRMDEEVAKDDIKTETSLKENMDGDGIVLPFMDGRGDEADVIDEEMPEMKGVPAGPRPHHKSYLDREFLLYLRDSPHCKVFPGHVFHDLALPVIRKHRVARNGMTRAELERETKDVMTSINDVNISYCVRRLNSFVLSDTAEAYLIGEIIFERAMDHPKLVARVCSDLSPHLFSTVIRQCVMELDLDRAFEEVRLALNAELEKNEGERRQNLINELLQKERTQKRKFASAAVFVAEMFCLGAPVKTKLVFSIIYKLLTLWQTKKEDLFVQVLCTVLFASLWRLKERTEITGQGFPVQQHRIDGLLKQLREVSTDPSTPEGVRFLLRGALNAQQPLEPVHPPTAIPVGLSPHMQAILGARPMYPVGGPGMAHQLPSAAPALPSISYGRPPNPQRFMWYRPMGPGAPFAQNFIPPPPPNPRPVLVPFQSPRGFNRFNNNNRQNNQMRENNRQNNQNRDNNRQNYQNRGGFKAKANNDQHVERMTGLFDKMMGELQKQCSVEPEKERKRHLSL